MLNRGLVMEIKDGKCIVLTPDGSFLKVPIPRGGTEIGQEIQFQKLSIASFKPLMAVASLLVAVFAWFAFQMITPAASAYVALDINPSIELGVDRKDLVISARGLNKDGEALLEEINFESKPPLDKFLTDLINLSIETGYLSPEKDNLIVATVTKTKQIYPVAKEINVDQIYTVIRQPIKNNGIKAELVVSETEPRVLKEAHKIGTTPGRYLIQQEAGKKGIIISNKELRENKIRELENYQHIKAVEYIKNANPKTVAGWGDKVEGNQNSEPNGQGKKDEHSFGKSEKDQSKTDQLEKDEPVKDKSDQGANTRNSEVKSKKDVHDDTTVEKPNIKPEDNEDKAKVEQGKALWDKNSPKKESFNLEPSNSDKQKGNKVKDDFENGKNKKGN